MTSNLDKVMALIPKLSEDELPIVRAALGMKGFSSDEGIDRSDWLLSGLLIFMEKAGMITSKAGFAVGRSKSYCTYQERLPETMRYLTRMEKQLKTETRHRPRLAYVCAIALADFLEGRKILSVETMLSQINHIPQAIDKSFPGYVVAGLFKYVLESEGNLRE